jgi:hypothetical protein
MALHRAEALLDVTTECNSPHGSLGRSCTLFGNLIYSVPLSGMVEMVWPEAVVNKGWNLRRSTRKRRIALKYFFKCSRQGQWGRAKSTKTQPHAISSCFGENALNGPTSFSVDYCGAR